MTDFGGEVGGQKAMRFNQGSEARSRRCESLRDLHRMESFLETDALRCSHGR